MDVDRIKRAITDSIADLESLTEMEGRNGLTECEKQFIAAARESGRAGLQVLIFFTPDLISRCLAALHKVTETNPNEAEAIASYLNTLGNAIFSFLDKNPAALVAMRDLVAERARVAVARKGSEAKLAKDPKQTAKVEAFKLWQDWQSGKTRHKGAAAFGRHIADKGVIESPTTVERWTREWKKIHRRK